MVRAYEIVCPGFDLNAPRTYVPVEPHGVRVSAVHGHRSTGKSRGPINGAWTLCTCGQWYGTRGAHKRIRIA